MPCTIPPWHCILLALDLLDIEFSVLFLIFLRTSHSKLSGLLNLQTKATAHFWMSNSPIKALTLWMFETFWTRSLSKIKSLRTFNTRGALYFLLLYQFCCLLNPRLQSKFATTPLKRSFPRPQPCNYSDSQFMYAPCDHIVTGDLNKVRNIKLRDLLSKGPKYREPVSYSWRKNFGIIMDVCEEHVRLCTSKLTLFRGGSSQLPTKALCQHQTRVHFQ